MLIAIAAGALFAKPVLALVVAQAATIVGCWINFAYARALGREYVRERLGARFRHLARVLKFIDQHGLMGNILIRSLPVGNCFAMNLLMAVSPVTLATFLIGTAIGTLPSTVVYVLLGNSAHENAATKIGLSIGIMVLWCVTYAFWLWRRRARGNRPMPQP
ncbi:MAG: VTT domain-containing protein [Planctomycetes bacterium]|nr:VTT domain-containing protein [Planctomycetota bacterium]